MTLSVAEAARDAPDRTALLVGDRAIRFDELAARVRARVSALAAAGVDAASVPAIALVGASDLETLVTLYALFESRVPVALLHPRLVPGERAAAVARLAPAALISAVPAPVAPSAASPADAAVPWPGGTSSDLDERPLALLFTSGTASAPKGVVLSRRAFLAAARASATRLGWQANDRWLLSLPIAHVGGLSVLTRCLIARRTVVVPEAVAAGRRLDPGELLRVVDTARVSLLSVVPTQLEWMLAHEPAWSPTPALRAVLVGGARARPALLERARARGVPALATYGLTEACSQVATATAPGEAGAAPLDGVEVRLRDGVIELRGPTLFSGYHPADGRPPFDSSGFFCTGDLGRFDEEGRLHVEGRASDLVVTGGENVSPAHVEAVLERCPGVAEACVFGQPDDTWGEIVCAAVVREAGGTVNAAELAAFAAAHLAPHGRPRRVAFTDALVSNANGKIDRRATAERVKDGLVAVPRV